MAEKIRVKCDGCGQQFRVSPDLAGKNARCPCGRLIAVPRQPTGEELARKWYYARKGERYGPVPLAELSRLLAAGEVKPTDYVWTRGMPTWQPAQAVEELSGILPRPQEAAKEVAAVLTEGGEVSAPEAESPPKEAAPAAEAEEAAPAEGRAADPPVARKETPPAEVPSRPAAEKAAPGPAQTAVPAYPLARALSFLLLGVGVLSTVAGMVLVVVEKPQSKSYGPDSLTMIFGGLVLVGLSQIVSLARAVARHVSRM